MAIDYDAPPSGAIDVAEQNLDQLKTRREDTRSAVADTDVDDSTSPPRSIPAGNNGGVAGSPRRVTRSPSQPHSIAFSVAGCEGYDAKSGVAERAESLRPLGSSHSSCRPRTVRSRK